MIQRKLIIILSVFICFFLCSCVKVTIGDSYTMENTEQDIIDIELSMDNVNDYIDVVSVGNNEWIVINKQYENGLIFLNEGITAIFEVSYHQGGEEDKEIIKENVTYASLFESIIESIDKPLIKDINGTVTFSKGSRVYIDDNGKRIVENKQAEESERAKYFNDYPY